MIIADTGFFLALANRRDKHHSVAAAARAKLKRRLITTWPVMTETCHLLANRIGAQAVDKFLGAFAARAYDVAEQSAADIGRIRELVLAYASLPMDLADASLVLLAERLDSGDILSTDSRDFGVYRWKNHKPFRNLLLRH
jgi:predicted nucleic acid-binding protein